MDQEVHVITLDEIQAAVERVMDTKGKSFDPGRFITFTQAIFGIISALVVFAGLGFGYVASVQGQIEASKERINKVEYQESLSIDDRRDIHNRMDKTDINIAEISLRLAHIDEKLDQIRARQVK